MERSLVERAQAGNAADAQDATQETFIAAWRGLPRLREPERFAAWLGRITTNACRMSLRHRQTVREIPMDAEDDRSAGRLDDDVPARQLERRATGARLSVEDRERLIAAATATQVLRPGPSRWSIFSAPIAAALVVALVAGVTILGSIATGPADTPPEQNASHSSAATVTPAEHRSMSRPTARPSSSTTTVTVARSWHRSDWTRARRCP